MAKKSNSIQALFLDVGGVLLSNGWDHLLRQKMAFQFSIDFPEMESRHKEIFYVYETGKIPLSAYLDYVIFFKKRPFTPKHFVSTLLEAATADLSFIQYIKEMKAAHNLKVFILSNEGKELMEDRISRFQLTTFVDCFIVSGFVGLRKPDPAFYTLALNLAQIPSERIVYLDDRPLMVEIAQKSGLQAILHENLEATRNLLQRLF